MKNFVNQPHRIELPSLDIIFAAGLSLFGVELRRKFPRLAHIRQNNVPGKGEKAVFQPVFLADFTVDVEFHQRAFARLALARSAFAFYPPLVFIFQNSQFYTKFFHKNAPLCGFSRFIYYTPQGEKNNGTQRKKTIRKHTIFFRNLVDFYCLP
jgi:hypothetical protein